MMEPCESERIVHELRTAVQHFHDSADMTGKAGRGEEYTLTDDMAIIQQLCDGVPLCGTQGSLLNSL